MTQPRPLYTVIKYGEPVRKKIISDNNNHVFTDKIGEDLHSAQFKSQRKKEKKKEDRKLHLADVIASKNDMKNFKERFG
jgi:hypothetical protein